ncbi:2-oxoacid:acceptor oxidoreductase family protein, partial [Candidatus Bathyarchaeota archaeon]|nr:2-oxoacid:acceptor oxidoreductase family protein [Candidatus Bathyarchaeota archaeon]
MTTKGVKGSSVSILIGGEAGQGLSRSGTLLGKALMRGGLHVYGSIDYPSVIRGSHNFYTLTASDEEVHSNGDSVDIVLALNKETVLLHVGELSQGGVIVYDEGIEISSEELGRDDVQLLPFPLTGIVKEIGGPEVIRNTVALGAG